jgi:hypothetical protein
MCSGGKFSEVCKFKVKCEKNHPFGLSGSSDFDVRLSQQAFIRSSKDIIALLLKVWFQVARNVLVKFDFYQALIFQTFSRVSSAA